MTISYRLKSNAENKEVSIKLRLSIDRENTFEVNSGFSVFKKDWSVKNQTVIPNNPKKRPTDKEKYLQKEFDEQTKSKNELQEKLITLHTFLKINYNKDFLQGIEINSNWIQSKIDECFNKVVRTDTSLLVNHIQYIIDNANTRKVKTNGGFKIGLSSSTIKNYTLFRNIILEYEKTLITKKKIHFIEITKPFVDKFTNWLINTKNYSNNYAGKQLEILKTVCIDAEKNEIQVAPYSKIIEHFREADNDRYIQTLSFDELEQIKNADFTDQNFLDQFKNDNRKLTEKISLTDASLSNARNWILLGCAIGQRGNDLIEITPENVRYKGKTIYIDIIQQKTKKSVTIGVIDPYIVDILENNFPKKIPHQKLNDITKVVCKLAGITELVKGTKLNIETNRKEFGNYPKYELIASHCFRRSFATNYYKKIPTAVLINITAHSKESLFLTYINKREDKDANADLFMKFYEDLNKDKKPEMKVIKNGTND